MDGSGLGDIDAPILVTLVVKLCREADEAAADTERDDACARLRDVIESCPETGEVAVLVGGEELAVREVPTLVRLVKLVVRLCTETDETDGDTDDCNRPTDVIES